MKKAKLLTGLAIALVTACTCWIAYELKFAPEGLLLTIENNSEGPISEVAIRNEQNKVVKLGYLAKGEGKSIFVPKTTDGMDIKMRYTSQSESRYETTLGDYCPIRRYSNKLRICQNNTVRFKNIITGREQSEFAFIKQDKSW